MLSRRHFLGVSSAAVAGTACQAGLPAQEQSGDELPPAIAALSHQTHRATAISVDERRVRIEKARGLMSFLGHDAMMLTGGTSLLYFSGIRWGISERLLTLIVPRSGEPFVVCPAFEEERARESPVSWQICEISWAWLQRSELGRMVGMVPLGWFQAASENYQETDTDV